MSFQKRMKASDVYNSTTPVFGSRCNFEEAFPDIKEIKVEITESGEGITQFNRTRVYSKSRFGEYINCSNELCYD